MHARVRKKEVAGMWSSFVDETTVVNWPRQQKIIFESTEVVFKDGGDAISSVVKRTREI